MTSALLVGLVDVSAKERYAVHLTAQLCALQSPAGSCWRTNKPTTVTRLGASVVTVVDDVVDPGVDDDVLRAAVIGVVVVTFVTMGVVAVVVAFFVAGVVAAVVVAFVVAGVVAVVVAVVVAMPTLKAISMATFSSSALMYASLYVAPREGHTLFFAKGNDALAQHSSQ